MRLAIVGLGLIGTSVFLAARRAWPGAAIVGLDRGDSLDPLHDAETVVLATPVEIIIDTMAQHAAVLRDRALVLDTGSTKRAVLAAARAAGLRNFVGGHPMAGAATAGPSAARADLFEGKSWFLIPAHGPDAPLDHARSFVAQLGARPVVMADTGAEHDRIMAAVSHLPQVVASALMVVAGDAAGESGLAWSGSGLRDTTRLADSEAALWASILDTNRTELRPLLERMAAVLHDVAGHLDDRAAVSELFRRANQYRRQLK